MIESIRRLSTVASRLASLARTAGPNVLLRRRSRERLPLRRRLLDLFAAIRQRPLAALRAAGAALACALALAAVAWFFMRPLEQASDASVAGSAVAVTASGIAVGEGSTDATADAPASMASAAEEPDWDGVVQKRHAGWPIVVGAAVVLGALASACALAHRF